MVILFSLCKKVKKCYFVNFVEERRKKLFGKSNSNFTEYIPINITDETEFEIISNPNTSCSNLLLTGEFNSDGNVMLNAKFCAKETNVKIATIVLKIIDSDKELNLFPKSAIEIKNLKVSENGKVKFKVVISFNF